MQRLLRPTRFRDSGETDHEDKLFHWIVWLSNAGKNITFPFYKKQRFKKCHGKVTSRGKSYHTQLKPFILHDWGQLTVSPAFFRQPHHPLRQRAQNITGQIKATAANNRLGTRLDIFFPSLFCSLSLVIRQCDSLRRHLEVNNGGDGRRVLHQRQAQGFLHCLVAREGLHLHRIQVPDVTRCKERRQRLWEVVT